MGCTEEGALNAKTGMVAVVTVQQFCDRGTLFGAIQRGIFQPGGTWSPRVARRALLRTAAEVARGLAHLHSLGVVHGDLKPANVLLISSRDDRRGFTAKVRGQAGGEDRAARGAGALEVWQEKLVDQE
ncbi:hypothetical protein GPECTOR_86g365 [Gonium pectorale]|uniref:Protein kinase domain-containing protein n=1 Tax=Gonium pectorale TaxID=33097 RepID=A0A150G143_GONPE|nr:hypothetical protein GPECTOR_86g365 [Gonium pectorale]|eukprot:KXZ43572.1 hypothetical protein GPECTOR_86g365 [Gonium pectorale]